jgi:undecaprenyl-diphosphatase
MMVTWYYAVFLGVVQGLTEFLPISSSGHLVLFQQLMGLRGPKVLLNVSLHVGTLIAIFAVFRSEIREALAAVEWASRGISGRWLRWSELIQVPALRMVGLVAVGTIPTGIVGVAFRKRLESMFGEPCTVGWMLILTGFLVGATLFSRRGSRGVQRTRVVDALLIGLVQGIAIIPGISRSGATIAAAIFLGMEREWAGRYSFLLSIPSILGALILSLADWKEGNIEAMELLVGMAVAGLVGYGALTVFMKLIVRGKFYNFAPYCWIVGILTLWKCM